MNRKKVKQYLKEIHQLIVIAENGETKEPMYYDFLNPLCALEEELTPWYKKLWEKIYNKYLWQLHCRITGMDEIPF